MTKKTFKLIANPRAGRGRAAKVLPELVRLLNARKASFDLELTSGPGEAEAISARACAGNDFSAILSIGGDGTLNEIVQKAVYSGKPVAVVPAGSGNDFSKALRTPKRLDAVVDMILAGRTKVVDAGRLNRRYFANGVGIGFDAAVNYNTREVRWVKAGLAVYFAAFLKTLNRYKPRHMTVTVGNETFSQLMFLVSVGNGTTCGGGFRFTPRAKIDDGQLDITLVKPLSVPRLLWHLPKVFLGTIDRTSYAVMRRADRLTVESEHPLPVQVDGEIYAMDGNTCEIAVAPEALTVIGTF